MDYQEKYELLLIETIGDSYRSRPLSHDEYLTEFTRITYESLHQSYQYMEVTGKDFDKFWTGKPGTELMIRRRHQNKSNSEEVYDTLIGNYVKPSTPHQIKENGDLLQLAYEALIVNFSLDVQYFDTMVGEWHTVAIGEICGPTEEADKMRRVIKAVTTEGLKKVVYVDETLNMKVRIRSRLTAR